MVNNFRFGASMTIVGRKMKNGRDTFFHYFMRLTIIAAATATRLSYNMYSESCDCLQGEYSVRVPFECILVMRYAFNS